MAEAGAAVLILEADIRGRGETGAQIVRRARLQRIAVLHHRFDRISRDGAGKTLILGLFAGKHGQRQRLFSQGAKPFERAHRTGPRVFLAVVSAMAFLPKESGGTPAYACSTSPTPDIGHTLDP